MRENKENSSVDYFPCVRTKYSEWTQDYYIALSNISMYIDRGER